MSKKRSIDENDLATFQEAIKGTKPLAHKKRVEKPKAARKPIVRAQEPEPPEETPFYIRENDDLEAIGSESEISYKQDAISHKILRKLHKGQYNVDAVLDLHGHTVEQAKNTVIRFLQQSLREELHVVLIIHGKGHHSAVPILKNKLNRWLRNINAVLAFCSAIPTHGGRGATYVLLKRMKGELT